MRGIGIRKIEESALPEPSDCICTKYDGHLAEVVGCPVHGGAAPKHTCPECSCDCVDLKAKFDLAVTAGSRRSIQRSSKGRRRPMTDSAPCSSDAMRPWWCVTHNCSWPPLTVCPGAR